MRAAGLSCWPGHTGTEHAKAKRKVGRSWKSLKIRAGIEFDARFPKKSYPFRIP